MSKRGLQRLTETDTKIKRLLAKPVLLYKDVDKVLNDAEKQILGKMLTQKMNELKGSDLDKLLKQIDDILPTESRNELWENNHYKITVAISKHIEDCGKMPTKNILASETGLSRQTISKHLKDFNDHPLYAAQMEQFKFMADRVLAKVIKMAVNGQGNVKAARLYFDIIGGMNNQSATQINTQNNYIQINQVKLNQDIINELPPDQRAKIEEILTPVLKTLKTQEQK